MMKAAQIGEYGDAGVVRVVGDVGRPAAGVGQVLVEVRAASLNPADSIIRLGYMQAMAPLKFPATLGLDMAGVVAEVGQGVTGLKLGDRVWGLGSMLAGGTGAFAEYAAAPAGVMGVAPAGLSFVEAASLPLAGISALQGLHEQLKAGPGRRILITGGSGGIGSLAIQMAKALGAYVAGTARGDSSGYVKSLGADLVVDLDKESLAQHKDYDLVFDNVGGEVYKTCFAVLRKGGVMLSMSAQPDAELAARYGVTALGIMTDVNTARLDRLSELVAAGTVKPHVHRTFPLDKAQEAFRAREAGKVRGKIVLVMGKEG
jgi:NADPH:quinone reductase-like Zn-dependent oxidoreductase